MRRERRVRHFARRFADGRYDVALAERDVFGRRRLEHRRIVYRLVGLEGAHHRVERDRGVEQLAVVRRYAVFVEHPLKRHSGNAARAACQDVLSGKVSPVEVGLGIAAYEEGAVATRELTEDDGVVALTFDVAVKSYLKKRPKNTTVYCGGVTLHSKILIFVCRLLQYA